MTSEDAGTEMPTRATRDAVDAAVAAVNDGDKLAIADALVPVMSRPSDEVIGELLLQVLEAADGADLEEVARRQPRDQAERVVFIVDAVKRQDAAALKQLMANDFARFVALMLGTIAVLRTSRSTADTA